MPDDRAPPEGSKAAAAKDDSSRGKAPDTEGVAFPGRQSPAASTAGKKINKKDDTATSDSRGEVPQGEAFLSSSEDTKPGERGVASASVDQSTKANTAERSVAPSATGPEASVADTFTSEENETRKKTFVDAVLALMKSDPDRVPEEIKNIIKNTPQNEFFEESLTYEQIMASN